MQSKTNRLLVPSLLVVAMIVVTTVAWLAFRSLTSIEKSQLLVNHTWAVIDQLQLITSSADDAETAVRRYLLSGDEFYVASYNTAATEIGPELDRFEALTADNPRQQIRAGAMRSILAERMTSLARNIRDRQPASRNMDLMLALSKSGRMEQQRLRLLAGEIEAEERGLLALRAAAAQSDFLRARVAITVASLLDFSLIVLAFFYLARERRLRMAAESAAVNLDLARRETEMKAEEIRALNAELETRVQQRTAELEMTNRELEAFSYSVSHDLRAPLRTVDGFSLALEEDYSNAIDDVGKDYIRRVRTGVQRMGQLIDSLLQLSRITRAEIARQDFDMTEMAESVAATLSEDGPGKVTRFHIEKNLQSNGDPKLVRVALENLLGNAAKFSSKTAEPSVHFGWDPEQAAWRVRDNGAGFDMHYADKLFNAFNRLHGDKDFKGSGIGLATVARVVRRHHGRIWADSIEGQGATFWFTLGKDLND